MLVYLIITNFYFENILFFVKYLSMKISIYSFVKVPNLGAFLDHNNPWSCAKPLDWNFFIEKKPFILPNKRLLF